VDRRLDSADGHVAMSDAKTDHLKSLNRFFMIPAFGSGRAKRKEEEAARKQAEVDAKNAAVFDVAGPSSSSRTSSASSSFGPRGSSAGGAAASSSCFHRHYTTPDGVERDETEVGIDGNLDQMAKGLERLKLMSQATHTELASQSDMIDRIQDRTDASNDRLNRINHKLGQLSGKRR
jgi:synaptosomal-associated protein 29